MHHFVDVSRVVAWAAPLQVASCLFSPQISKQLKYDDGIGSIGRKAEYLMNNPGNAATCMLISPWLSYS